MNTKQVDEIMVALNAYPHIPYWFTIRQACAILVRPGDEQASKQPPAEEILVFDEEYKLLGTVRQDDLLRGVGPEFMPKDKKEKLFEISVDSDLMEMCFDRLIDGLKQSANEPVRNVMRPIVKTVRHNDHIIKVLHEMIGSDLNCIPVFQDDKVIGVVRKTDIFLEIAHYFLGQKPG